MDKVICIVGPTATGKTALAIKIAKKYRSVLISADSRQVYRGMNIVTGKDHPSEVSLAGIDICEPDQSCSVSVWYDAVKNALSQAELPIVVGGTGFYIRAVTEGIATMAIPPDDNLRQELEHDSVQDLQHRLGQVDPDKFAAMNNSDRNNPRRLIRAIEVALSASNGKKQVNKPDTLMIGLAVKDQSVYEQRIADRVDERIGDGAVEETQRLIAAYPRTLPSLTAIGYGSIVQFIDGKIGRSEMRRGWIEDEIRYAKRQMTWFKKQPDIRWFDPTIGRFSQEVADCVASWYDTHTAYERSQN